MVQTSQLTSALLALVTLASAAAPNLNGTIWKKTVFLEEFSGPNGSLPSSAWIIDTGTSYPGGNANWGTWEVETYTRHSSNVKLSGQSTLWITPVRSSNGSWTSGRIETARRDFHASAGGKMRIEASIRMPDVTPSNGLGYWPSFWTLGGAFRGNYQNWPEVGEYDIMENVNALDSVNYGLHCGTNPGGVCNEPTGLTQRSSCPNTPCNGNWHRYSVIVDRSTSPENIRFYIDGRLNKEISETTVGSSAWSSMVHHGHYIVLNVAMGGAYPDALVGPPGSTPNAATISGKEMRVDYVGVWTT